MIETLRARITQSALHHGKGMGFLPAFGLFRIDDRSLPVGIMYDRVVGFGLGQGELRPAFPMVRRWYAPERSRTTIRFLLEVQQALEKGEITFYAQPEMQPRHGARSWASRLWFAGCTP